MRHIEGAFRRLALGYQLGEDERFHFAHDGRVPDGDVFSRDVGARPSPGSRRQRSRVCCARRLQCWKILAGMAHMSMTELLAETSAESSTMEMKFLYLLQLASSSATHEHEVTMLSVRSIAYKASLERVTLRQSTFALRKLPA